MSEDRKTYIENNEITEALENYLSLFSPLGTETVDVLDSVGRITAKPVFAKCCDPEYNASAMDGIAVLSEKTLTASELSPLVLRRNEYEYVNTGNPIPKEFDSVIMIEDVLSLDEGRVSITSPSRPWQHIRVHGESVVVSEMVLPSKRKIRPFDLGAILASGNKLIEVYKKPRVAIIPTGNEMVEDASLLECGKLMESNTRVFQALTKEYGAIPHRTEIIKDEENELLKAVKECVKSNDAVIINAGSSAGTKDYTAKVISRLGKIITHGLAIKPGKPTVLGIIEGKPVIGVPGYPVSAYMVYDIVVKSVINKLLCFESEERQKVTAVLTKRITSSLKNKEFIRVALGDVNGKLVASPLERGAAAVMSMVKADGLLTVDRFSEGIDSGTKAEIELLKPLSQIKKSLVITGSHDVVIDIISDFMPVSSAHVGSLSGIFALKSGSAHISPIHLLDSETGIYNIPFVKKYFPNEKMVLIKGLNRIQGIILPKGNPKQITSLEALRDKKIRFANRQNGAGTRLLLDYMIKNMRLSPDDINGYEKEFTTHLSVADAVKNGVADMGLGVLSAAKILGLDFIPVGNESYDFLLYREMLSDIRIQRFIQVLKSPEFREKADSLGGYGFENIGEVTIIEND